MPAVTLDQASVQLGVAARRPALVLTFDEVARRVAATQVGADGAFRIEIDGRVIDGWCYRAARETWIRIGGRTFVASLADIESAAGGSGAGNELRADMPGTVVELKTRPGDAVADGQILLTIESMKLQMNILAPFDGTVDAIHVEANATFDRGALLVSLVRG